jgi:hypothetical protein
MLSEGEMIEPGRWPLDPVSVAAHVVMVIDDIDASDDADRDAMLFALLSAAWGSAWAREQ